MTDQQKASATEHYGGPVHTPNLDRIVAQGILYERAYTPHPLCVPARISFWTARWPHSHGARTNEIAMPAGETHFARVLHENGYVLGHFGKNHCFTREDLDTYFERVFLAGHGDTFGPEVTMVRSAPPGPPNPASLISHEGISRPQSRVRSEPPEESATYRVTDEAARFLEEHAPTSDAETTERPMCLWVSIPDPHTPRQAPEPYASRYPRESVQLPPKKDGELATKPVRQQVFHRLRRLHDVTDDDIREVASMYYGMIDFLDERVGFLLDTLDRLGIRDNTIIVFTADHGDYIGEHGLLDKSNAFYDCLTRVPLFLAYPEGLPSGGRESAPVSLIDVLPTVLTLAGVPLPDGVQGQQLPGTPGAPPPRDAVFSEYGAGGPPISMETVERLYPPGTPRAQHALLREREGEGHGKMLCDGHWKYTYDSGPTGGEELYDLRADPWELDNLASNPHHAATVSELRRRLLDWMLETENARPVPLYYDTQALLTS